MRSDLTLHIHTHRVWFEFMRHMTQNHSVLREHYAIHEPRSFNKVVLCAERKELYKISLGPWGIVRQLN